MIENLPKMIEFLEDPPQFGWRLRMRIRKINIKDMGGEFNTHLEGTKLNKIRDDRKI